MRSKLFLTILSHPFGGSHPIPGLNCHLSSTQKSLSSKSGRGGGIRTPDPLLPKQLRYQAALHPDTDYSRAMLRSSEGYVNAKMDKKRLADVANTVDIRPVQQDNALLLKRP